MVQIVCDGAPLANPVLIAILVVSVLLESTGAGGTAERPGGGIRGAGDLGVERTGC
jgi:hypothetical protein